MRFRCAQCRALTQVELPARMSAPQVTACSGCGRKYRFAMDRPRGADDQERYRRAKTFSEANQIDLGSAYSVLEGVMTLEEAHGLRKGTPAPRPPAPRQETAVPQTKAPQAADGAGPAASFAPGPPGVSKTAPTVRAPVASPVAAPRPGPRLHESESSFDPTFAAAVRDGCLSPQQALERGDRRALALRLTQRHRLSMDLAFKVADNRLTVHLALQQKAAIEAKEPPRPQTSVSHGVWNFTIFTFGALILTGLGVHIYHVWGDYLAQRGMALLEPAPAAAATRAHVNAPPEPPPSLAPPPMTVARTDTVGQIVEVIGPDPRSILISFCQTGRESGRREPIEIAPTVPPDASARWGVFRSLDNPAMPLRAILIRKDPRTGRWSAGDGRTPIMTGEPPRLPAGSRGIPVAELGPRGDPSR